MSPIPDYQLNDNSQVDDLRFVIAVDPTTIEHSVFATPTIFAEENLDNAILIVPSAEAGSNPA